MKSEYILKTEEDTKNMAKEIAFDIKNKIIFLNGEIGAGKTTFTKYLVEAFGLKDEVCSPTFALENRYETENGLIIHFDLYRLNTVEELENIGYGEYVGGEGLTLIEWADNFLEEMPEESLDIYIKIVPEGRLIQLLPNGERYLELCEEVEKNADFSH